MKTPGELVSTATLPFWVGAVSWGPGSQWIAAGGFTSGSDVPPGGLAVIDAASGVARWQMGSDWPVDDIMVSPDGHWLAVAEHSSDPAQPTSTLRRARVIRTDNGAEQCRAPADHQASNVVFSPDSSCVAATVFVTDEDPPNPAWVFDAADGHIRCEVAGHTFKSLAFSPDSRLVAAGDANGTAVVFDAATGAELPRPDDVARSGAWGVAFSPDGKWLAATFGYEGTIRLFEASTGRQAWAATMDVNANSVAFSADGQWVAAMTTDTVSAFRVADGSLRFAPAQVPGDTVTFSPTLRQIAIGLTVLDAAKGSVLWQASAPQIASPASYSDDGRWLAVGVQGPAGGLVNVYDTSAEQARRVYGGPVTSVTANKSGMRLAATASADQKATIFQADTGDLLLERVHPGAVSSLAFSPDGQFFVTGSTDANARLFQTVSGTPVWKIGHGGPVNAVAFSGDSAWVATASSDRTARVLSRETGQVRCQHEHGGAVTAAVFSPDAQLVATGSADRVTRILSAVSGDELHRYAHDGRVRAVTFSPSGALLATGNEDGTVLVIDTATGQQRGQIVHTSLVTAVAISSDGQLIATGGADQAVRLCSLGDGALPPPRVLTCDAPVTALAFSPAGPLLAVVTGNPVVRILDPGTGAEAYRLIHPAAVHGIAFSGDGALIVTACDDGIARVFQAALP